MIESTFCIFPGIGPRIERYLWRLGVFTWTDFLECEKVPGMSTSRKSLIDDYILEAQDEWNDGNLLYFKYLLGPGSIWRLWGRLSADALCLDIETDGKRPGEGLLTVAGFYSHGEYRPYICGRNLTEEAVHREFADARLLVTFSGATFDLPYLKTVYPDLDLDIPHLDLCPAGHKVGLKGGLKKVEKLMGIQRADELEGVSGYEAVLLWRAHLNGAPGALETLVSYNREDTMNLQLLADRFYGMLRDGSGITEFIRERGGPPCVLTGNK